MTTQPCSMSAPASSRAARPLGRWGSKSIAGPVGNARSSRPAMETRHCRHLTARATRGIDHGHRGRRNTRVPCAWCPSVRNRSMPPAIPPPRELLQIAETLLIATAGGVAFTLIGFPAGLVAGSMLAVALSALIGRPMQVPLPLARVCFVLVGILLGAVAAPDLPDASPPWPAGIAS